MGPKPWGHKITFVVYVPGSVHDAEYVADNSLFSQNPRGQLGFIGTTIDPVQDEPKDQG